MAWWNSDYPFRRNLRVIALEDIPEGHTARHHLPEAVSVDLGKVRSDHADLEILYYNPSEASWTIVGRSISVDDAVLEIDFPLEAGLSEGTSDPNYYAYYGNRNLVNPVTRPVFIDDSWPASVDITEGIFFTRPGEHWIDGVSRTKGAKATLRFSGSRVRIKAMTGPDQGIAEVQVDTEAWEEVDLYDTVSSITPVEVYENINLEVGVFHVLRYVTSGRKNPSSSDTQINLTQIDFAKQVTVTDEGEEIDDLSWSSRFGGT